MQLHLHYFSIYIYFCKHTSGKCYFYVTIKFVEGFFYSIQLSNCFMNILFRNLHKTGCFTAENPQHCLLKGDDWLVCGWLPGNFHICPVNPRRSALILSPPRTVNNYSCVNNPEQFCIQNSGLYILLVILAFTLNNSRIFKA